MPLTLDENTARYQIKSYTPGTIKINEQYYNKSVIITPTQLITDWSPQCYAELNQAAFLPILALKPQVLLIGTGHQHELLSIEMYGELINARIGVEVMSSIAACRTFNALAAENRQVAAALLIR